MSASGAGADSMAVVRKIAFLGFRGVGKSSIVRQFSEHKFDEIYQPTLLNTVSTSLRHRKVQFALEVLETAGQDEYSAIPKEALIGVHGYVFVYSVASRSSLEKAALIHESLLNAIGVDNVPMVLVGNKLDLDGRRQVTTEEGQALAAKWGCDFVETSALLNENVVRVFQVLLDAVEKDSGLFQEEKESSCVIL